MRETIARFALAAGLTLSVLALGKSGASAMPALDRGVTAATTEAQAVKRAYWHRWHYWHRPYYWHRWHYWHRPYYWHRWHHWHRYYY
jgi:hypothetical protein